MTPKPLDQQSIACLQRAFSNPVSVQRAADARLRRMTEYPGMNSKKLRIIHKMMDYILQDRLKPYPAESISYQFAVMLDLVDYVEDIIDRVHVLDLDVPQTWICWNEALRRFIPLSQFQQKAASETVQKILHRLQYSYELYGLLSHLRPYTHGKEPHNGPETAVHEIISILLEYEKAFILQFPKASYHDLGLGT